MKMVLYGRYPRNMKNDQKLNTIAEKKSMDPKLILPNIFQPRSIMQGIYPLLEPSRTQKENKKMNYCEELIQKIVENLPDPCTQQDLVEVGLYPNLQLASQARKVGNTPEYIKLGKKILYPKLGIIEWLNTKKHERNQEWPKNVNRRSS